jgi:uncharacterized coiled-coil protein SlyX
MISWIRDNFRARSALAAERRERSASEAELQRRILELEKAIAHKNKELATIKHWIKVTHRLDNIPAQASARGLLQRFGAWPDR